MKRSNVSPFMFIANFAAKLAFAPEDETGAAGAEATEATAKKAADDAKAAGEAEALKVAEAAEKKAKEEADAAAAAAEGSDDPELKKLSEEKNELVREVMDKKAKLKTANDEAEATRKKLAEYGDVDPEKVKKLLDAESKAEKAKLEAAGEFDALKKMMREEHERTTKTLTERIAELEARDKTKDNTIDELTVGRSFADSTFIADDLIFSVQKSRQLYGDRFGIEDGVTVAFDKPLGVEGRQVMVDANGAPLKFDEAMKRIIEADPDKETIVKTKKAPGAASKSNPKGGKPVVKDTGLRGASRIAAAIAADI